MNYKAIFKLLSIFTLAFFASNNLASESASLDTEEREEVRELLNLGVYIISEVMGEYYTVKEEGSYGSEDLARIRQRIPFWPPEQVSDIYIDDKVREKGFDFLTQPFIDKKEGTYVQINPRSENFGSEIQCLVRETRDGKLYEYWVIKTWHGTKPVAGIFFFITVADSLTNDRSFLIADSHYINVFKISESSELNFPESDLKVLYNLQPWNFPTAFPNSDLPKNIVYLNKDKEYVIEAFNPKARINQEQIIVPPEEVEKLFGLD